MLQTDELQIVSGLRSAEVLVKELREMRVKVSPGGHESFEAWRSGAHDDLVLATALACWRSKWRVPPVLGGRRLGLFFRCSELTRVGKHVVTCERK
jgi:hypothetical protein